jgi:hypothetical protein
MSTVLNDIHKISEVVTRAVSAVHSVCWGCEGSTKGRLSVWPLGARVQPRGGPGVIFAQDTASSVAANGELVG